MDIVDNMSAVEPYEIAESRIFAVVMNIFEIDITGVAGEGIVFLKHNAR